MFVMGDEARRTQMGNNNGYCQDNALAWLDWDRVATAGDLVRFTGELIAFRKSHPRLRPTNYFHGRTNSRGLADLEWHGCRLHSPGWNDPASRVLAFTLAGFPGTAHGDVVAEDVDIHAMLNMEWDDLDFDLPAVEGRRWYRVIDTGAAAPDDILSPGSEKLVDGDSYRVANRSVVVLISRPAAERVAQ